MTNIDLTKLDRPLGEYDIETQVALFRAHREGGLIEYKSAVTGNWTLANTPTFYTDHIYRLMAEPARDIDLPWSVIDDRWQWAARDKDGIVWLYEQVPALSAGGWECPYDWEYEQASILKHNPGNKPWNESLIKRPENT